jgi:uncharacterized membrane protein YphA (DoxX/SURF4 family)
MRRRIILALRLLLGAIFLYAAYTKLKESYLLFAMSIDSYQILPPNAVLGVARTLPWVELGIGLWLVIGWRIAPAATAATTILAVFFGVMLFTYGRGMTIDCGCFGLGEAMTWKTLVRDGSLVAASGVLAVLASKKSSSIAT